MPTSNTYLEKENGLKEDEYRKSREAPPGKRGQTQLRIQ